MKEKKSERLALQGERLRIALKCKHVKHADIYNKYMKAYDLGSAKVLFSKYIHGEREIPVDLLRNIAQELDIPFGYLQGTDDFMIEGDNLEDNILQFNRTIVQTDLIANAPSRYMALFDLLREKTRLWCSISTNADDTELEYSIYRDTDAVIKDYTPEDMEKFYDRICKYVGKEFNKYISVNHTPQNPEEYAEYVKQHPLKEGDALD